ncbi:hypothetical protein MSMEI_0677 [Mycolicibacterium smegmatis MC2 155]|uniref:Uncharacterized protein n=1 Tax=Mycolicibacterium smegmatis (strain ATCC 700084 / mc(2)155) TaxID=246196 RepID=I7FWT7_MYCS2|nr:hypothetical protein MSMEI_0677 [Mycolicibacterium smegmatis MC2 155]
MAPAGVLVSERVELEAGRRDVGVDVGRVVAVARGQRGVGLVARSERGLVARGDRGLVARTDARLVGRRVVRVAGVGVVLHRGAHRVVLRVVAAPVATDRGLVAADVVGAGVGQDDRPAVASVTAGRAAAADPDQAVTAAGTATVAAAHVDVADDRAVVARDQVTARGLRVVLDVVVLAHRDVGPGAGQDVAVVGGVAVTQDRAVTADDVTGVVPVDHHAAVGGGVRGLVAQGDVTEAQVERTLLRVGAGVLVGAHDRGVVVARQIGVVVAGHLRRELGLRRERRGDRRRELSGDVVVVGDRALQAHDRVAAAEQHTGRGRGGRNGVQLGGRHVGQARIAQAAVRVGDECGRRGRAAEQVEDEVDQRGHCSNLSGVSGRSS